MSAVKASDNARAFATGGDHVLYRSPDVLVYTMGKVGSTSISTTLRTAGIKCFDIHHLRSGRIAKLISNNFENSDGGIIPPHLIESLATRNVLSHRRARGQATKIITCIREPVSRNISAVYQNLPKRLAEQPEQIGELVAKYNLNQPDEWFEQDFKPTTNLDILGMSLDRDRISFRIANELFDVLMLKLESPDEAKSEAISDFVGSRISLKRANEAKGKWYNEMYLAQMKSVHAIPGDFLRRCFNLRYFRSLYSDREIESTARRYQIEL